MLVEDIAFALLIPCYIIWAYYIKRSSSWAYAIAISFVWAPFLFAFLQLQSMGIVMVYQDGLMESMTDILLNTILIHSGGFLMTLFYVLPVWGKNAAKILLFPLMTAIPTPFWIFIAPLIFIFHIFDFFAIGWTTGKSGTSRYKDKLDDL